MRIRSLILSICVCSMSCTVIGCGDSAPVVVAELAKVQAGLNGGTAFPLPENLGFAEIVIERTKPGKPVVVAVYLLDETAKKSLASEPSAVRAKLITPVADAPAEVTLSAKPKTGKSEGKRYVTTPGDFDFDELRGEILVTLGGKDLVVPFALR